MQITTAKNTLAHLVHRYWMHALFATFIAVFGGVILYNVVIFLIWMFTESPQQRASREYWDRYHAWQADLSKHLEMCIKKNGKRHFGPMIGFAGIGSGGCGTGGRSNGVACTWNNQFQDDLKVMWDNARARNACVVWEPSRVTWRGADRMYSGVTARADDNVGGTISVAFKEKKLK